MEPANTVYDFMPSQNTSFGQTGNRILNKEKRLDSLCPNGSF